LFPITKRWIKWVLGAVSILGLDPSSSQRPVSSFEIIFQNSKPAVWAPGNWHYSYQDFRIFDFFRVEGSAFKCLRFCKFLLSQILNAQKGCTFLCVRCHFDGAWCVGGVIFFVCAFLSSMHSSSSCKSCELICVVHSSCKSKSMFVLLLLPQVDYLVVEDFKSSSELFIPLARTRTCLFCCCCHT
jgi:hypothetical protein